VAADEGDEGDEKEVVGDDGNGDSDRDCGDDTFVNRPGSIVSTAVHEEGSLNRKSFGNSSRWS
jgi:hypothetical protein